MCEREQLKYKQRIVIKVGSSTITHEATGNINFLKLEKLVRILTDLHNQGKEVVLVTSGAVAVGRKAIGMSERPKTTSQKQACAAIGQARLMMSYEKLFSEYNQVMAQVLMTKNTMVDPVSRENAKNTFEELSGELLRGEAVQLFQVAMNLHLFHALCDEGIVAALPDGLLHDGLYLLQRSILMIGAGEALDQAQPVILPENQGNFAGL